MSRDAAPFLEVLSVGGLAGVYHAVNINEPHSQVSIAPGMAEALTARLTSAVQHARADQAPRLLPPGAAGRVDQNARSRILRVHLQMVWYAF